MLGSSAIHTQHIIGAGFPRDSPELAKGWSSVVHECDLFSQKKAMNENVQDENKEKVHNSSKGLAAVLIMLLARVLVICMHHKK